MLRGILASVIASALFALVFFFGTLFPGVSPEEVYGWRIVLSVLPITIYVWMTGGFQDAVPLLAMIRRKPWVILLLLISAGLVALMQWLFMFTIVNDMGLDTSMGYFLLPLSLIVIGRFVYQERLTRLQFWASIIAAVGVGYELLSTGIFSWVTALIAVGYPLYFVIRRELKTQGVFGLWLDTVLVLPLAVYFIFFQEGGSSILQDPYGLGVVMLGLGVVATFAMITYIVANKLLPMNLFGLLSYVEPILLVFVALLVGEAIHQEQYPLHIAIWLAMGLLVVEGVLAIRREKNRRQTRRELPVDTAPITL